MSQLPRLTLLGAMLIASLGVALPSRANDDGGSKPAFQHSVPRPDAPDRRAKDAPAPADEEQAPSPGGCPLRQGKLELIA